jgi:hypothetical protein
VARFSKYTRGKKHYYVKVTPEQLRRDRATADELYQLIATAYAPIGGHLKFASGKDLTGDECLVVVAADIDNDPDADVVSISKRRPYGLKSTAMGHDGSRSAKTEIVKHKAKQMKRAGNYAEMSDAIAHIMITRYDVPAVQDARRVREVLGKKIEWVGAHPDGKYPKHKGWYYRTIGGKRKLKIMLGHPRARRGGNRAKTPKTRKKTVVFY